MSKLRQQRVKARKARVFRRRMIALVTIVVVVAALGGIYYYYGNKPSSGSAAVKVLLKTSMGDITIQLYDDMPITAGNFKSLVERGIYNDTIFHRVVPDFVIQGGDATEKGITVATIPDELPNKHSNVRGSVAMAKTSEPNSATSQFFINLKDNSGNLDSNYSVFGRVIVGMDVVDAIGKVATSSEKPLQDVRIIKAELIK